jgi:CheY-like chemotaxis protein
MSDERNPPGAGILPQRLVHDLRNFLAPIRNIAQVLKKRGASDPDLKAMADLLERQVIGASALLDGVVNPGDLAAAPIASRRDAATAPQRAPSRRILIADDNAPLRASLGGLLQDLGHVTIAAADGPEALKAAAEQQPEFVFIDIHMPGLDGYEVARRLRAQFAPAAMKLVAMSGDTLNELARRGAKEAGFDYCIDKLAGIAVFEDILAGGEPELRKL